MWEWNGATWANKTTSPLPSLWPGATAGGSLAYDPLRDRLVLFDPTFTMSEFGQLWEWSRQSSTWLKVPSPMYGWPVTQAPFLAFDDGARTTEIFDGLRSGWSWAADGGVDGGVLTTTQPPINMLSGYAASYDSRRDVMVMFGPTSQVWERDPMTRQWANRTPTPLPEAWPPPRTGFDMAYDTADERLLLFGGASSTDILLNDFWGWAGDTASRPGVVAHIQFSASGAETGSTVTSVALSAVGGASSDALGSPGVRLLVSAGDSLTTEVTAVASPSAPSVVSWQTTAPARLQTLFEGPERWLTVGLTPLSRNRASRPAVVKLEWVEVLVRYRRP